MKKTNQFLGQFFKNKLRGMLFLILIILNISATFYFIYGLSLLTGIENILRILVSIILIILCFIFILWYIKAAIKMKKRYLIFIPITILYSIILIVMGIYVLKTYKTIEKMSTNYTSYSSSLVSLSINDVETLDNINKKSTIGILNDTTSIDGNQIPNEIIDEEDLTNEIIEFNSYIELIKALYNEEVDYVFLPTNYAVMFQNIEGANFEKIESETKIIYTKNTKIETSTSKNTTLNKPFTILIMGVDSEVESIENATFNGDALMLITFNPTTLSTTILSIPRDTYVPIACFSDNRKNKITHAAWYGQDCMIETIENFTGITIDYYVKINFKGVVNLVNTLGGVEVDVPYNFCEQNSNREWGENTIYVEEGLQTLNGEQALAFARNRHPNPTYCSSKWTNYDSNDFIRGQHQQIIIRALLNKLKSIKSLNALYELLDTISKSMETNMTTSEILSLYNVGKDILTKNGSGEVADLISMQRLYLSGVDKYIYDQGTGLTLYNYVLYEDSLEEVENAMKINLELIEPTIEESFAFNIDSEYEESVIGKGDYSNSSTGVKLLPDFTGDSVSQATKTANNLGLKVTFKYVTIGIGTNNTVISQNYEYLYDISYINSLVLTVLQKTEVTSDEETEITEITD
ncbi:MAG: LCP family protein [Bacilli bacterium]